jgi:hypothetical protein
MDKRANLVWIAAAVALLFAGPLGCWRALSYDLGRVHHYMNAQSPADGKTWRHPAFVAR